MEGVVVLLNDAVLCLSSDVSVKEYRGISSSFTRIIVCVVVYGSNAGDDGET